MGESEVDFYKVIGKNIAKYRNFKGLTQEKLADLVNTNQSYMNNIENAKDNKKVSLEMVGRISDNLNIPIKLLFMDNNNIEIIDNNNVIHSSEYFYEIFRLNLRRYRKALDISQEELAKRVGVMRSTIGKIESSKIKKHFTILLAYKISNALNVSIDLLFNEDILDNNLIIS